MNAEDRAAARDPLPSRLRDHARFVWARERRGPITDALLEAADALDEAEAENERLRGIEREYSEVLDGLEASEKGLVDSLTPAAQWTLIRQRDEALATIAELRGLLERAREIFGRRVWAPGSPAADLVIRIDRVLGQEGTE